MEQLMLLDIGPANTRPERDETYVDPLFDSARDLAIAIGREAAGLLGYRSDELRKYLFREVKRLVVERGFCADQHQYLLNVAWTGADDVVQRENSN